MPLIQINNPQASNFLNQIYQSNDVVCFYYWNSCGHCQAFKPIFYDVIQDLQERRDNLFDKMIVVEVEYDDFNFLPDDLRDINAFPSVISYSNGRKTNEFNDQRTPSNLEKFILSSLNPSSSFKSPSKLLSRTSSKPKTIKTIRKYKSV